MSYGPTCQALGSFNLNINAASSARSQRSKLQQRKLRDRIPQPSDLPHKQRLLWTVRGITASPKLLHQQEPVVVGRILQKLANGRVYPDNLLFLTELEAYIAARATDLDLQDVCRITWAIAVLQLEVNRSCIDRLCALFQSILPAFIHKIQPTHSILPMHPPLGGVDTLHAQGKLTCVHEPKFASPQKQQQNLFHTICSMCWAAAALHHVDSSFLLATSGHLSHAATSANPLSFAPAALRQLYQADLYFTRVLKTPSILEQLPRSFRASAHESWLARKLERNVSKLQKNVFNCLHEMGVPAKLEMEHVTPDGIFLIDIALKIGNRHVAIEVDGPLHFTRNACHTPIGLEIANSNCSKDESQKFVTGMACHRPLGGTVVRDRLLAASGWETVSIPFYEWYELGGWQEKHAYLERKLEHLWAV